MIFLFIVIFTILVMWAVLAAVGAGAPPAEPKREKRRKNTALDDLAAVAPLMAQSRREWTKLNRDAMDEWEKLFDPVSYREKEREKGAYRVHPTYVEYLPPLSADARAYYRFMERHGYARQWNRV
jgi:hypothetical protein